MFLSKEKLNKIQEKILNSKSITFIKDGFIVIVNNEIIQVIYSKEKIMIDDEVYYVTYFDIQNLKKSAIKLLKNLQNDPFLFL